MIPKGKEQNKDSLGTQNIDKDNIEKIMPK